MQVAMQASYVQGRVGVHPSPSALYLRQQIAGSTTRAACVPTVRRPLPLGQELASVSNAVSTRVPIRGLEPLKLACKSRRGGSCRAGAEGSVGAYSKNAFVDDAEANKLAQVAKRLERTAGYFRRLGSLGFWGQLVCTVVAAVILAFSVVITGQATSPVSTYLTAGGIAAAFLSVFWSFGYIRLSHRLRDTINDPTKAPPRAQVVKNLKNGIIINLLGLGATLLGLQATVGVLVAKALTSSSTPYLQGAPAGFSPVLALDVFLVQASGNALVSHFLGLLFSLELLRSVTLSQPPLTV